MTINIDVVNNLVILSWHLQFAVTNIADCNFAELDLTFAEKSTSVLKIQFHKDVQPLVVCLK